MISAKKKIVNHVVFCIFSGIGNDIYKNQHKENTNRYDNFYLY